MPADFNGDPNVISNTEESAQARDVDNLDVNELAKLVEETRLLEKKNKFKNELKYICRRINSNNTINNSGLTLSNQSSVSTPHTI